MRPHGRGLVIRREEASWDRPSTDDRCPPRPSSSPRPKGAGSLQRRSPRPSSTGTSASPSSSTPSPIQRSAASAPWSSPSTRSASIPAACGRGRGAGSPRTSSTAASRCPRSASVVSTSTSSPASRAATAPRWPCVAPTEATLLRSARPCEGPPMVGASSSSPTIERASGRPAAATSRRSAASTAGGIWRWCSTWLGSSTHPTGCRSNACSTRWSPSIPRPGGREAS